MLTVRESLGFGPGTLFLSFVSSAHESEEQSIEQPGTKDQGTKYQELTPLFDLETQEL
ncbi:MAG: hypothetical protein JWM21_144 [Acidobacteria bacterium]|nr:hypothetical protein [Acidobacteriota bacterium]